MATSPVTSVVRCRLVSGEPSAESAAAPSGSYSPPLPRYRAGSSTVGRTLDLRPRRRSEHRRRQVSYKFSVSATDLPQTVKTHHQWRTNHRLKTVAHCHIALVFQAGGSVVCDAPLR